MSEDQAIYMMTKDNGEEIYVNIADMKRVVDDYVCELCGYKGVAIDNHHIHGRKNSRKTIRVCCNCHAEIHRGARTI